jgi:hypothetical protein
MMPEAPTAPGGGNGAAGPLLTLELDTPIDAHGESVRTLRLRALSVNDLVRVGYPVKIGGDGGLDIYPDRMTALIARLADIPTSSAAQLSVADWHRAMEAVVGFFAPSARTRVS